jgi:hypothetical protein
VVGGGGKKIMVGGPGGGWLAVMAGWLFQNIPNHTTSVAKCYCRSENFLKSMIHKTVLKICLLISDLSRIIYVSHSHK